MLPLLGAVHHELVLPSDSPPAMTSPSEPHAHTRATDRSPPRPNAYVARRRLNRTNLAIDLIQQGNNIDRFHRRTMVQWRSAHPCWRTAVQCSSASIRYLRLGPARSSHHASASPLIRQRAAQIRMVRSPAGGISLFQCRPRPLRRCPTS